MPETEKKAAADTGAPLSKVEMDALIERRRPQVLSPDQQEQFGREVARRNLLAASEKAKAVAEAVMEKSKALKAQADELKGGA